MILYVFFLIFVKFYEGYVFFTFYIRIVGDFKSLRNEFMVLEVSEEIKFVFRVILY